MKQLLLLPASLFFNFKVMTYLCFGFLFLFVNLNTYVQIKWCGFAFA